MISVIVPSYGRPERIEAVVNNIHDNTTYSNEIIVVVEEQEYNTYDAALGSGGRGNCKLVTNKRVASYAGAVNSATTHIVGHHVFVAADDLNFHSEWDDEALKVMSALDHIKVVGTNDLLNTFVLQGLHATHYLVDREYIWQTGGVIDGRKGEVLFEGYAHNFVDTEFIGTAKARAVFAPCLTSFVEHNHYTVGKSDNDPTYEKGAVDIQKDADTYYSRRELWWNISK